MTTTVVAGPAPSGFSTSKLTRYWVNTSRSLIVNSVTLGPLILTLISEVRSASLFKYGGLKRTLKPSRNNDTLNWWRQLKQSEINFFYKFFLSVVKRNAFVPNIFSGTQMFKTIWSSWGKPQHSSQILDVTTWPNTDSSGHTGTLHITLHIVYFALTWPCMWVDILRTLRVVWRGGEAPKPGKYWRGVVKLIRDES